MEGGRSASKAFVSEEQARDEDQWWLGDQLVKKLTGLWVFKEPRMGRRRRVTQPPSLIACLRPIILGFQRESHAMCLAAVIPHRLHCVPEVGQKVLRSIPYQGSFSCSQKPLRHDTRLGLHLRNRKPLSCEQSLSRETLSSVSEFTFWDFKWVTPTCSGEQTCLQS